MRRECLHCEGSRRMSESSVFEKRIDTPSGAAEVTAGDPSAIGTPAFTVLSALVDVAVLLVTLGIFLGDEAWLKAGGWVTLGFTAVGGLPLPARPDDGHRREGDPTGAARTPLKEPGALG